MISQNYCYLRVKNEGWKNLIVIEMGEYSDFSDSGSSGNSTRKFVNSICFEVLRNINSFFICNTQFNLFTYEQNTAINEHKTGLK